MSWDKLKIGQKFINGLGDVCVKRENNTYDKQGGSRGYIYIEGDVEWGFKSYYKEPKQENTVFKLDNRVRGVPTKTVLLLCSTESQEEEILRIYNDRKQALAARKVLKLVIKDRHIAVLDIEIK